MLCFNLFVVFRFVCLLCYLVWDWLIEAVWIVADLGFGRMAGFWRLVVVLLF